MKQSWTIARVAGIEIRVHVTFLLLLAWVAFASWSEAHSLAATTSGVAFVSIVFGCVVAHELGHALAARRYGVATRDITLLPIGGVARLSGSPPTPQSEIVIALAGPAVNIAIAAGLYVLLGGQRIPETLDGATAGDFSLWHGVLTVNLMLALFNLVPAFPMDGCRVLRALLVLRVVPVVDGTRLIGLVDIDNLVELSRIQAALAKRASGT